MDMTDSIAPRSDQMNAEDLLSGPRTFTIKEVRGSGSSEQPVEVVFEEFPAGRPFKPSKTVMRIMVAAWDKETDAYVGKRMTLYRDPTVRFGGQDVGGIRVSHMSGIKSRLTVALTVSRGKRALYVVEPLTEEPKRTEKSLQHRIAEAISAFAAVGVDVVQLESSVGKQPGDWQADDLAALVEVYKAIKGGKVTVDEAFPPAGRTVDPQPATDPVEEPPGWES